MPRKIDKNTTELVSARSLGRQLGVSNTVVEALVKRKKLKPVQTVPYATGVMRLYQRSALQPLVEEYIAAQSPAPEAQQPEAPAPASPDRCLDELAKHLAVNDATLADQADLLRGLQQSVGILVEQNKTLFKLLEKVHGDTSALAAGLIGGGAS